MLCYSHIAISAKILSRLIKCIVSDEGEKAFKDRYIIVCEQTYWLNNSEEHGPLLRGWIRFTSSFFPCVFPVRNTVGTGRLMLAIADVCLYAHAILSNCFLQVLAFITDVLRHFFPEPQS